VQLRRRWLRARRLWDYLIGTRRGEREHAVINGCTSERALSINARLRRRASGLFSGGAPVIINHRALSEDYSGCLRSYFC
jgi:hypothetical protein